MRIFTFFNFEITDGPRKGYKMPEGSSFSYIYTVADDQWVEARGFLVDQRDGKPRLVVWTRVKD